MKIKELLFVMAVCLCMASCNQGGLDPGNGNHQVTYSASIDNSGEYNMTVEYQMSSGRVKKEKPSGGSFSKTFTAGRNTPCHIRVYASPKILSRIVKCNAYANIYVDGQLVASGTANKETSASYILN